MTFAKADHGAFEQFSPDPGPGIEVHRQLKDGDLYYIDNRSERAESTSVSLRVADRLPEVSHAESGRSESTSWHRDGDRTVVPLELGSWEAVLVVMRKPTTATSASEPVLAVETAVTLDGQWRVAFQPGRHAPESAELSLTSWSVNSDDRIKYFAGTGTYSRTIVVPAKWLQKGTQLWLDLGEVHELAEVSVNGKSLGVTWRPPYKVEISGAVHAGQNTLEIAVTVSWANRLIHDAIPNATDTFTTIVPSLFKGTEPLMAAGLVGPVTLLLRH